MRCLAGISLLLTLAQPVSAEDVLAKLNLTASEGAAAGYVDDAGCGTCHVDKFQSYQNVGMAQSFKRPHNARLIETRADSAKPAFGEVFYHAPSQRYYQINKSGDKLDFKRWQQDADGTRFNAFSTPVDWVMGSGNRARSYLFQTQWGQLYQLPLGWYSENRAWGMSPGFEAADHMGVQRQVKRQCMFCHNAFPQVDKASDHAARPHRFPHDLPEGTGCQRCHGPGAGHIRAVLTGAGQEEIQKAITNPAKLPPVERDSVCFQCHMLPAVALVGLRRFGIGDYAFRPGDDVSQFLVHMDITEPHRPASERFEINHHGYRMWMSSCYQQSAGELGCISCHDPHEKPESGAFRQQVAKTCRGCHQPPQLARSHDSLADDADCATCHMPTRRTQDVIEVTMTDHRIARGPFDNAKLLAELAPHKSDIVDTQPLPFAHPPTGTEAQLYRAASTVRTLAYPQAVSALKNQLVAQQPEPLAPYLILLQGQLQQQQCTEAEKTAKFLLQQQKDDPLVSERLAVALIGQQKFQSAIALLKQRLAAETTPSAHFNLGLALSKTGELEAAKKHLEEALRLQPLLAGAHKYLGLIARERKRHEAAVEQFKSALAIQPNNPDFYQELLTEFKNLQQPQAYNRWLNRAQRLSSDPKVFSELTPMTGTHHD